MQANALLLLLLDDGTQWVRVDDVRACSWLKRLQDTFLRAEKLGRF
jgi:hypothetical protein